MKIVNKIRLYKVKEAIEILEEKYQYKITKQNLCTKAAKLNAYVTYNGIRYLPEEVFPNLTINLKFKETKMATEIIIDKKIQRIKPIIRAYEEKYPVPSIKPITELKSQNTNTQSIIHAVIQLQQEIAKLKQKVQEKEKEIQ
ncbi:hypothetical protein A7978_06095 (plasmid) [Borrelia turicatae]|uniref:Uncharacterized protein n=1 Tax=Borrelia turicatae TaxID=142 RepID=A0A172XCV6_BORTU|nr:MULTISPECIES: hypothetical protein [Borrelia]ANF34496.1 hypothetical protein A7978_06095 [Borrelia turicatae]UPA12725.1 hypothetical protein bvRMA01_001064 [Borrelia venezuelensis]UPA14105.1 hypothetical protein bt91E135_001269 [Borrelia turicatae 91E135]UPA15579.1 hypothetical protein btBTE5EL_001265 [Borrelia turicatae]